MQENIQQIQSITIPLYKYKYWYETTYKCYKIFGNVIILY